ncbi:MAG TPA: glycerol-3-phosphate dehydrogenase/oxidase [Cytophagaceae bacterium]|jgi:glycerol-3-phosphate dehydrogenase|nr:glycerol-3-phosphate dehydrogenase/oxidase [Cytophagaceae bacterium]
MTEEFSYLRREEYLNQLTSQNLDLIIVGGGITGAGILLDATTRGMKAALFEMQDFSQGTSSRSTKLVHGGLRYLKQFEFSLVKEVGRERAIVFENGPHVTKSEPMLLPIVKGGSIGPMGALFGMWLYDKLAGVKKKEQRRIIHKASVLAMEPFIKENILISGAYYYEYRTDDSRLTLEILKEAAERGANALNYCKVTGFLYTENKISGVKVTDLISGTVYEIHAKAVVNATGPWVDETDTLDGTSRKNKLLLSKGVHIVVDASRLPIGQAIYFDAGAGRMVFAIPRAGKVYLGTTESEYHQDISKPIITKNERDYLLTSVNALFSNVNLKPEDVESGWAGLRPLIKQEGKKPGEISRKDETFVYPSGLISIAGGKLTGYRKMGERVTDLIAKKLQKEYKLSFSNCMTHKTPISGGKAGGSEKFETYVQNKIKETTIPGWSKDDVKEIVLRYGTNCDKIFSIASHLSITETSLPSFRLAELEYSIRYEMTASPLDFFVRRTAFAYFNIQKVIEEKEGIVRYMQKRLGWDKLIEEKFRLELEAALEYLTGIGTIT